MLIKSFMLKKLPSFLNKPLFCTLSLIFIVWFIWLVYLVPEPLPLLEQNWPVSLTMIFGSFIAGATSEGGGAIAFPVFTKVLQVSPLDAKVFSLAIQSIGMMAATLTIVVMRVAVEWRIVFWASLGGIFGIVLGASFISPLLSPGLLKMLFTAMIVSFSLTLILLNWKQRLYNESVICFSTKERLIVLLTGFCGGIMTGLLGNGIDIICFSVMVLLFRLSEKLATPTSVVLMAFNSVVGFALHVFVLQGFTAQVETYWLAAIPVVVVGAPLGAYCCTLLNNKTIASILIVLIMIEFVSSLYLIPLTQSLVLISSAVFFVFLSIYYLMFRVNCYIPKNQQC